MVALVIAKVFFSKKTSRLLSLKDDRRAHDRFVEIVYGVAQ